MLEWVISSAVLTVIVIALRFALKGRISLRLQYGLWALVLLRLLIPFSFGSAGFSVGNLTRRAAETETVQLVSALVKTDLPRMSYRAAYEEVAQEYAEKGVDIDEIPLAEFSETADYEIMARMSGTRSILDVLKAIWLLGIAVIGLVLAASNLCFAAKLKKSRRRLEGQTSPLPVYVTAGADTPCLFGLLHPAIYLTPEAVADDTVLRHSIQHELTHFRHGDHIWAILRGVCLALHWYDPLVWWAAVLSQRDGELACDEATVKRLGESERAEYGRTLIAMTCGKRPALLLTATTMSGRKNSIRERILLLAKKPKTAAVTLSAVILLAAVAVGCTFTGAKEREESGTEPPAPTAVQTPAPTEAATPTDVTVPTPTPVPTEEPAPSLPWQGENSIVPDVVTIASNDYPNRYDLTVEERTALWEMLRSANYTPVTFESISEEIEPFSDSYSLTGTYEGYYRVSWYYEGESSFGNVQLYPGNIIGAGDWYRYDEDSFDMALLRELCDIPQTLYPKSDEEIQAATEALRTEWGKRGITAQRIWFDEHGCSVCMDMMLHAGPAGQRTKVKAEATIVLLAEYENATAPVEGRYEFVMLHRTKSEAWEFIGNYPIPTAAFKPTA